MTNQKPNRLQLAKLKRQDAGRLMAEGKTTGEINEFIREKYKCGSLSWGTLAKVKKELKSKNTIILKKNNSTEAKLQEAGKRMLALMKNSNIVRIIIDTESDSMSVTYIENQPLNL